MIGCCDACQREDVPVRIIHSYAGDTVQCYLCTGDTDPDPYGELLGEAEVVSDILPSG